MRDPVELPRRRRRGEAPTVAKGAEKGAAGCVGVCRCVSDCCVVSSESHARCLRAEPTFSSFHFPPRFSFSSFLMHWIPCRTLIMTFNNTAPVPSTQLAFNCKTHICYKIKNGENSAQEINANRVEFSQMWFTTKCSANSFLSVIIRKLRSLKCFYPIRPSLLYFQMSPGAFIAKTLLIGLESAWFVFVWQVGTECKWKSGRN